MTGASKRALTLIELMVVVLIIGGLALLAIRSAGDAQTRAKTVSARSSQRQVNQSLSAYRLDFNSFPIGRATPGQDPVGIFSIAALSMLTTPVSYCNPQALVNPFAPLEPSQAENSPFPAPDRPFPSAFQSNSMLYFNYRILALVRADPRLNHSGFALVSTGPDQVDSFSVYFPFPDALPPFAGQYGIHSIHDTLYDPSNGATSPGDITLWGGELPAHAGAH